MIAGVDFDDLNDVVFPIGCSHFSKDIVFVVSDGDADGLQAWLKAYHGNEESTQGNYRVTATVDQQCKISFVRLPDHVLHTL